MRDHEIVVVFDGWKSGGQREETFRTGGITVIYSKLGEKADSVIKRIISKDKKEWTVISSDREVMTYAWSQGCVPVASEKFLALVGNMNRTSAGEYDLLFTEEIQIRRKGVPERLPGERRHCCEHLRSCDEEPSFPAQKR